MATHVVFGIEHDPGVPAHAEWLGKLMELLAAVPEGLTYEMEDPYTLRDVPLGEFIRYLESTRESRRDLRADAARMWRTLVRVCGDQLGLPVPSEQGAAEIFPLPLKTLRRVTFCHFDVTGAKNVTRRTLLEFIKTLD